jgi:putative ABC transport system permease protein
MMSSTLLLDLRHSVRSFRRRPLLAGALGIAATTGMLSVIDAVLLRPLPFPDPDRVVSLQTYNRSEPARLRGSSNPADVAVWKAETTTFSAIAAYQTGRVTLVAAGQAERVGSVSVSVEMDRVLGLRPQLGRFFQPDEFAGRASTVLLTDALWRSAFQADPAIIGRTIMLSGTAVEVIGVLPPTPYPFPGEARAIWWPLRLPPPDAPAQQHTGVWQRALGRIAPTATLAQARADMERVVASLRTRFPRSNAQRAIDVMTLHEAIVKPVRPMLLLLSSAVLLVLAIACANIANLLLAHANERGREYALRRTLGAETRRLTRLILTESATLAVAGACAGVWLAPLLVQALIAVYPGAVPRAEEIGLNWRVLLVAVLATGSAAVVAAMPALARANRLDLFATLRSTERGLGSRRDRQVRALFVVMQVALCVLILIGSGILLRTFVTLSRTQIGFDADNLLTFSIALPYPYLEDQAREIAFYDALLSRVRALPGVQSAGTSSLLPMTTGEFLDDFRRAGRNDEQPDLPSARLQTISVGYLETLGLQLLAGRTLQSSDRADSPPVVVVNDALAQKYLNGRALGERILFRREWREIIGVVGDKRHHGMRETVEPDFYLPLSQSSNERGSAWVVVRTSNNPSALARRIRGEIAALDAGIAMADVQLMKDRIHGVLAPDRFRALLISVLGTVALALALLGVYSLMAYTVSRQTREIGVRMALGESRRTALTRVLQQALVLSSTGAALGLAAAWLATGLLAQFALQTTARDPLTFVAVPAVIVAVAVCAALAPAIHASRVDPLVAMRDA